MILLTAYLITRYGRRVRLGGRVALSGRDGNGAMVPTRAVATTMAMGAALLMATGPDALAGTRDTAAKETVAVSAADLMPMREATAQFLVTTEGDDDKLKREPVDVKIVQRGEGQSWRLQHAAWKSQDLHITGSRGVVQTGERLEARDSVVRMTPGVTMLPVTLRAGDVNESQAKVRVTNLRGNRVKAEGEYVRRVELVGRRVMQTPAGTFDVHVVRTTERFKFSMANARVVTTTCYALGVGPVHQHIDKSVTKLGLFTDRSSRTMVLSEPWTDASAE